MSVGLRIILLLFALVGFGGAGASFAIARYRKLSEGERDTGMMSVSGMLLVFGVLCAGVGGGLAGIFAFGVVVIWASYVVMARNIGMFEVDSDVPPPPFSENEQTEESRKV